MAQWLRQSTAATVTLGPAVDITDGVSPETGLAAGTVDEVVVTKHDSTTPTDISGTTTMTHRAGGRYTVTLSTTDTNTLGRLRVDVRDDNVCLPFWAEFLVVPATVYDSLVAGNDALQTDVTHWLGTAVATPATAGVPHVNTVAVGNTTQTAADLGVLPTRVPGNLTISSGRVAADATAISGNVTAADNVEANIANLDAAISSRSTYAGGDTAGTTTLLTRIPGNITISSGRVVADATAISGNSTAADNVEANIANLDVASSTLATASALATVDTEVGQILADTGTDGVVIAGGQTVATVTDVTNRVTANADQIAGNATAATNLSKSALAVVPGACEGTPTTTVIQTDLAETTDDHYIGRVVVFTSGNAAGEATDITDYTGATGTLTVTALTTAPAAADTFVIV